jgi:hypothetical protein
MIGSGLCGLCGLCVRSAESKRVSKPGRELQLWRFGGKEGNEAAMQHDGSANGQPGSAPFKLHYDAWDRLVLTEADGRQHVGVEPIRAFPISDPGQGLSICDAEGHEIRWIDRLDSLSPALRQLLQEDLARREFVPVLRRIAKISVGEPSEWEVDTDRGPTRFVLKSEDDVRTLAEHRALIIDAHGTRYLIADTRTLDAGSRRLLERYF